MSQDKLNIGQLITTPQHRDAIHIAVAPCVAAEELLAGQPVELIAGRAQYTSQGSIGVVDPFLKQPVKEGECFWIFMNPNSVTVLRHAWEHKSFDGDYEQELVEAKDNDYEGDDWCRRDCP